MKKHIYLSMLLIAVIAFSGCKDDIEGDLGEAFDKVEGFSGTWELVSFIQKDLNNPIKEERDLSRYYIEEGIVPLTIEFRSDLSYSVDIEMGRNFFGDEGTWSFDNNQFPTFLQLSTGMEDFAYNLGSVVLPHENSMSIEYFKGCEGTDQQQNVVYRFEFTRK